MAPAEQANLTSKSTGLSERADLESSVSTNDLQGLNILITGGSNGLGAQVTRDLATLGFVHIVKSAEETFTKGQSLHDCC